MQAMDLDWCFRLVVATICGGFIGYERSARLKNAGIRTHIIVALGAALAMLISKYGFYDLLQHPGIGLDPSRITVELEGILTDKQDIDSVLMKIAKNPAVVEVQRED